MSTTTPNFGWTVPTSTDYVKDGAAAIETLGDSIDASLVDLKGGTTGQVLAKNTNTDMDFVWTTPQVGDITEVTAGTGISGGGTSGAVTITNSMATAIDAKGDLVVGTGADAFSRLAVGTNNQVLTADSSTATGLVWSTPASGSLTQLASTSMSGNSFTFSSISGSYKNLLVILRGFNVTSTGTSPYLWHTINGGVTNASYATGNNTSTVGNYTDATRARMTVSQTMNSSGQAASVAISIPDYANTAGRKISTWHGAYYDINASRFNSFAGAAGFETTSAVTSITISLSGTETFNAGTAILYGVN